MPARESAVLYLHALDERTEDDALRERRERRARDEGEIPRCLALRDQPKLKRNAAEYQRQQHHDHRQIKGWHDDRIGNRERDQETGAAEHEPGLVAVPEWCDRAHHLVALAFALGERKQNADAEIEAVEDDIHR